MHMCHTHFQYRNSRTALLVSFLPLHLLRQMVSSAGMVQVHETYLVYSKSVMHTYPFLGGGLWINSV